jgi:crotonobetainyl-CoA:carnitine CoA-transferase CaiB-like acyl-CoA transferase
VALAIESDAQWSALTGLLGAPRWVTGEMASVAGRRAAHDEIDEHLRTAFEAHQRDELVETLAGAGVPAAPVLPIACLVEIEQLRARGYVEQVDHPVVGMREMQGIPFRFSTRSGPWFERPAPTLGQHNHEVLTEVLGLTDADLEDLAKAGVIGQRLGA